MISTAPRRVVGIDGKRYPMPIPQATRDAVVGRCHYLRHDENLSVRQIREALAYNHNVVRSVGSIAAYLAEPCTKCSGEPGSTPEHRAGIA